MEPLITRYQKYFPILLIIGLAAFAWKLDLHHYLSLEVLHANQVTLQEYIHKHFLYTLLIYFIAYVIVVALSLPVATAMTLIGGFLFGQWIGTFCVVLAATSGATLLFLSVQWAWSDFMLKKTSPWIHKMQAGFQENASSYLLILRLIPLFPFVGVNLAAAFFQVPLKTFILTTFFGIIPAAFIYVSIGVSLNTIIQAKDLKWNIFFEPKILVTLIGLSMLALLPVLYKWYHRSRSIETISKN